MTDVEGFRLLIVGIDSYKDWPDIPVIESAESIESSFLSFGAGPVEWASNSVGSRGGLNRAEAAGALRRWFNPRSDAPEEYTATDPVNTVMYWGGHGEYDAGHLWLMTHESPRSGFDSEEALEVSRLGRALELQDRRWDAEAGWTLVILDCCQAGVGIQNLIDGFRASDGPEPRNVGFLAAAGETASFSGELARAVAEVLASLTGTDEDLPLWELVRRVGMELGNDAGIGVYRLPENAVLKNPKALGGTLTATVESLDTLESLLREASEQPPDALVEPTDPIETALQDEPREVVRHFLNKAQGTELDERAWYFEGRDEETRQLVNWLAESAGGMYVVTGDPGAGKSAFLGRAVVFAEPRILEALLNAKLLTERPAADLLPSVPFDAVIHLTAKSYRETLDRIGDVVSRSVGHEVTHEIEAVLEALATLDRPITFLVDALDEALDPFLIAASLLRRLAGVAGVRVVVGTRRSMDEGPDKELDRSNVRLIKALGFTHDPADDTFGGQAGVVHPLAADPAAVSRYVTRRLTLASQTPYPPGRIDEIATKVSEANQPFLFARLATTELLARPPMSDAEIDSMLAAGHRGIFAAALQRFDKADEHAVPLLRSLAYSLGRGFPQREGIWKKVTEAIHPGLTVRERDIANALKLASAYIVHDGEFGQATYRLAHRTFAEHFLAEP